MTHRPESNFSFRTATLLGLILVIAAALRLWSIGHNCFWLDEFLTVSISNGHGYDYENLPGQSLISPVPDFVQLDHANSVAAIWTDSARDVHPPLFYVLMRFWRHLVPDSDAWMRVLSTVFSLIAIVMLFLAVEVSGGTVAGLWAALLMSLAGVQIQYSQENRMYMLLLAALLGAAAAYLRIERYGFNWRRGASVAFCTFFALMSHYAALPLAGLLGLYSLARLSGEARRGAVLALAMAGLLFAATWGPLAYKQTGTFSAQIGFSASESGSQKFNELRTLAMLPLRFFATTEKQTSEIGFLGASLYVLPLLLIRRRPELLFWWTWLIVAVGAVAISDFSRSGKGLYWIRYTLAASPAAYALAAMMLAHVSGWMRHLVPMTLALSSLLAIEGAYDRSKPDWRLMGKYIDAHFLPGDVLVIADLDRARWPARSELVSLSFYAHLTAVPTAILEQPPSDQLRSQLLPHRIWFFTDGLKGPTDFIPGSRPEESFFVPGVGTIFRIEMSSPETLPSPVNAPPRSQSFPSTASSLKSQR